MPPKTAAKKAEPAKSVEKNAAKSTDKKGSEKQLPGKKGSEKELPGKKGAADKTEDAEKSKQNPNFSKTVDGIRSSRSLRM